MTQQQPNVCGVDGCQMKHGLYPQTEHVYMKMSDEDFDAFNKTLWRYFGICIERRVRKP